MGDRLVGFIGAGNIAWAIVDGIIKTGYIKPKNIYMYDVLPENTEKTSKYGVSQVADVSGLVKKCGYIFLTVKPQIIKTVLEEFKNDIPDESPPPLNIPAIRHAMKIFQ